MMKLLSKSDIFASILSGEHCVSSRLKCQLSMSSMSSHSEKSCNPFYIGLQLIAWAAGEICPISVTGRMRNSGPLPVLHVFSSSHCNQALGLFNKVNSSLSTTPPKLKFFSVNVIICGTIVTSASMAVAFPYGFQLLNMGRLLR